MITNLATRLGGMLGHKDSLRGHLVRGGLGSLAIMGGHVTLQFATSVGLARALGPEGFGVYAFALAVTALLTILGQLGFPAYLVRMVAVYRTNNQFGHLKGLLVRAMQFVGVASLSIAGFALVLMSIFKLVPVTMPSQPLLLALGLLPLLALLETGGGALRGLGHVLIGQVPTKILRPTLLLLLILAARVTVPSLTPSAALLFNAAATAAALAYGGWVLIRRLPPGSACGPSRFATSKWTRGAVPFMLLAGAQVINHQTDIVMLGIMTAQDQVGLYRVAVQVTDGLGMALMAIAVVIAPQLAQYHAQGDWARIQRILVSSHRAGVALMFPAAGLLVVGGAPFLGAVFGHEYSAASQALLILTMGKVLYATVGFSGVALSMFGLASVASIVTGLTAALNVALNLLLIPSMGMEGAAIATASSALVVAAGCIMWMRRLTGRDFSFFGTEHRK